MTNIKLEDLYLPKEESRHIIELLAKKRNIINYKTRSSDKLYNIFKKQSKNKKRIDDIREELKNSKYIISKSELKHIKKNLHNIEKQRKLSLKKNSKYLDELDKRILSLDKYSDDDDYDIENLFKISINKDYYKPKLNKSGCNNNYIEYRSEGDKLLTIEEYLDLIKPYLKELINDHKNKGEWKIQLTAQINFISLRPGSDETRVMHTENINEEFMNGSDTDEIIKELFKSFLKRYQENLQEKMKGSDFAFDGVNYLYYNLNKISISSGGSYIDSPKWLKDKKSTVNQKNNDNKCFQYAVILALNIDKINDHPERISKIKPFIDKYNWEDIDFPSTSKDWKTFELNNEVALNVLYVPHGTKKIEIAYKSKHNLTREMPTKNVEMPTKDNNIIKYNQGEKSIKLPFIVCGDLECFLEKMSTCCNTPEESSTTKINKHTSSGYSIFTHCSFDKSKNKLNYYRGEDCMTKVCKDLREHATKIINYEKKDTIPLTKKEEENYNNQKVCYICKKEFDKSDNKHHTV